MHLPFFLVSSAAAFIVWLMGSLKMVTIKLFFNHVISIAINVSSVIIYFRISFLIFLLRKIIHLNLFTLISNRVISLGDMLILFTWIIKYCLAPDPALNSTPSSALYLKIKKNSVLVTSLATINKAIIFTRET